jgi:hypothetical protein
VLFFGCSTPPALRSSRNTSRIKRREFLTFSPLHFSLLQILDPSVMPFRKHLQRPMPVVDSSSSHVHPTRAILRAEDVCVGCIVWLPDMMETSYVRPFRQSDKVLNVEGYYHPAVILGIRPRPAPGHINDLEICFALVYHDFSIFRTICLSP